jgi:phage shock protein A
MSINAIYGKIQNIENEISSLKSNSDNVMLKELEKSVAELSAKVSASSLSSSVVSEDSSVSTLVSDKLKVLEESVTELSTKVSSDVISSKLEELEQKIGELTGKVCELADATEKAKASSNTVSHILAIKIEEVDKKLSELSTNNKINELYSQLKEVTNRVEYLENKE